jgi:tight adherence protein B
VIGQGPPSWMGWVGMALVGVGIAVGLAIVLASPASGLRMRWATYEADLEKEVRFLLYKTTGARIARMQLAVVIGLVLCGVLLEDAIFLFLLPLAVVGPKMILTKRHEERVLKLEQQLDSWLLILANSLKATPSLGEALGSSAKLMRAPISEEVDIALKEITLGTPIDQAILGMSTRIGSLTVSGALATLLVGRQTGGDLPAILEQSALTLREMSRLEGVVRTKTAEGKAQAYVLGAIPFVLVGAIHLVDEHWLPPLFETGLGLAILSVALTLWVAAIFRARRILTVDV